MNLTIERLMELNQLQSLITAYHQGQPETMQETEPALRTERNALTREFLDMPDEAVKVSYDGDPGKRFHLLRKAGLQVLARDAAETRLAGEILQRWEQSRSPAALLAAMVMLWPRELPLPRHFTEITEWLRQDYADFLLTSPGVFSRIGEADQYATYFAAMVDLFHRSLIFDEAFAGAEDIRNRFVQQANFIQFYFNEKNLRRTYRQRADIMESWALRQHAPLAHLFPLRRSRGEKIKVGILSAHFTPQTEIYLMLSYFDKIPREQCHVTLYSLRRTDHPLEEYCRTRVDQFVLLPEGGYPQRADRIRADDLDILLIGTNTSAVTNPIAILAMFRMARRHVIVENSPVSTGFTHTDYYLSSEFNEPDENAQAQYTERLYRVPGMLNYYAYHMDKDPRTVNITREQLTIPADAVVCFSGANFFKILPDLSNVWAWIFSQVQHAYLVLMPFNPNWTKQYLSIPFINRLRSQMETAGVDFVNRVRILNRVPTRADVHSIMGLCDIYLDSFPYAGACSLIDPLLVGLPIVCRAGGTMRGRLAEAMLRGAGLEEMIVPDAGAYVERAVALAREPELREQARAHIRDAISGYNPFFDTGSCGVKVAAAFTEMTDRLRRGEMRLLRQPLTTLKDEIASLSIRLSREGNLFFQNLNGTELARLLLVPYFQSLGNREGMPRLVDVGPGNGQFAMMFLNAGWRVDLFETNPAYHAPLDALARQVPGRVRRFSKFEARNLETGTDPGELPAEMIRIGSGEEEDINTLLTHDFKDHPPKLILLDASSKSPISNSTHHASRFTHHASRFSYDTSPTNEDRLTDIRFDDRLTNQDGEGNQTFILFREDDPLFLVTLLRLLDGFLPGNSRTMSNL